MTSRPSVTGSTIARPIAHVPLLAMAAFGTMPQPESSQQLQRARLPEEECRRRARRRFRQFRGAGFAVASGAERDVIPGAAAGFS